MEVHVGMLSADRIEAVIQQTFDQSRVAGFAMAVVKGEEGLNEEEKGDPLHGRRIGTDIPA